MSIKVMSWYWEHSTQDGHKLLALLALADWSNDEGECYPGIDTFAARIRRDRRSAQRVIGDLEAAGELVVYPGMGKGPEGRRSSLYYLVRFRDAAKLSMPPMAIEAAQHYRQSDRSNGAKGLAVRKTQALLSGDVDGTRTGDTDVTPPCDADVAPTGDAHVTPTRDIHAAPTGDAHVTPTRDAHAAPTGDTRVTQNHQVDPSVGTVRGEPPPPCLARARCRDDPDGGGVDGGGGFSVLARALMQAHFPAWNNAAGYVRSLTEAQCWALCTWLWVARLLDWQQSLADFTTERGCDLAAYQDYLESKRDIEATYAGLFAGIHNRIGLIRKQVSSNYAAPLAAIDRAALRKEVDDAESTDTDCQHAPGRVAGVGD